MNATALSVALSKFDENLEVETYIKREKEELLKECDEYLLREDADDRLKGMLTGTTEVDKIAIWCQFWYGSTRVDDNCNLLSNYNPYSLWDWYDVGGRWDGIFKSYTTADDEFQFVEEFGKNFAPVGWYINELEKGKELRLFGIINSDSEYISNSTMGYWGISYDEQLEEDDWHKKYISILKEHPDDYYIIAVDFHI